MHTRPVIGITSGDPSGIGPEITLGALSDRRIYDMCDPLVLGSFKVFKKLRDLFFKDLSLNKISDIDNAIYEYGTINILDIDNINMDYFRIGEVNKMSGAAAYSYVEKSIHLALTEDLDAIVTNPINKEALNLAGYRYAGHTEILAQLTGTKNYSMMLARGNIRVVHVSTHVSLRHACDLVKKERVLNVIKLAHKACIELGIKDPAIAVSGLNPHSSEGGLFGHEETEEIIPAVKEAQRLGFNVTGPLPPDSVFSKALNGMYDIVVAMYHDQGHIPIKFHHSQEPGGVNITLGLPIIRVSVDHGTAFDIAWKNTASPESLKEAIRYASLYSNNKKRGI